MTTDFSSWINRTETAACRIDEQAARNVALTLNTAAPEPGKPLPELWQWAFFHHSVPTDELGPDGHPRTGNFLPPMTGRNRMWAGGRVKFIVPLKVGQDAQKTSVIKTVSEKTGSEGGSLIFVTVEHTYSQHGNLAISEEQDIVYRQPAAPKLIGAKPAPQGDWKTTFTPTPTLLFRYSAVTFNTHRIHYDFPYVTAEEGYPGLVVHGPLIATLMMQSFTQANPGQLVSTFKYRGLRPLIAPTPFEVGGCRPVNGTAEVWAEQNGTLAHQAVITVA